MFWVPLNSTDRTPSCDCWGFNLGGGVTWDSAPPGPPHRSSGDLWIFLFVLTLRVDPSDATEDVRGRVVLRVVVENIPRSPSPFCGVTWMSLLQE